MNNNNNNSVMQKKMMMRPRVNELSSSRFFQSLILLIPLIAQQLLPFAMATPIPSNAKRNSNEMLVPLNSTTALICEPVFNAAGGAGSATDGDEATAAADAEARWMRNGQEVARVSGHSNAVIGVDPTAEAPVGQDPIPEIGFLVIQFTRREDEGEYWCERISDGQQGERTRLRVAFIDQFPAGAHPTLATALERGQLVMLDCPQRPGGVPAPIISWQFNGERITDFQALNAQMAPNGSLLLHNFGPHQSGAYACEAANFVAHAVSEPVHLPLPSSLIPAVGRRRAMALEQQFTGEEDENDSLQPFGGNPSPAFVQCLSAFVRNGVLWFLIGCLSTSCIVLAYILGALFLHRMYTALHHQQQNNNNNNRLPQYNHRWPPLFASGPGFRKVVAPMPTTIGHLAGAGGLTPPPAYEEEEEPMDSSSRSSLDV